MKAGQYTRRALLAMVIALLPPMVVAQPAAQLVMIERDDCPWCQAWWREIGPGYALSDEGKQAPLRRVQLGEKPADLLPLAGVHYTPTFILLACRREIGRITGYPGADFFYPLLGKLLAQLAAEKPPTDSCS